jgi:hypothetical protein
MVQPDAVELAANFFDVGFAFDQKQDAIVFTDVRARGRQEKGAWERRVKRTRRGGTRPKKFSERPMAAGPDA